MTQSLKDRIVQLHAIDCNYSLKEVASRAGCSIARVTQVYLEFGLRRYGLIPHETDHFAMRKSVTPYALIDRPEHFVAKRPTYNACQYRDPRSGDYCGATTEGSAYCGSCRPKTASIGRARYSFSEGKRGAFSL